ncbi:MAG: hypothetical protein PHT33_01835 [bacterium]|nr:hypothetical protein [bacterium]
MDCLEIRELIPVFVDEELSACLAGEVISHTDACASCRRELYEAERMRRLLSEWAVPQTPPAEAAAMRSKLLRGLTARQRRERTVSILQRGALRTLAAAAAVTVLAMGLWCGQRLSRDNSPHIYQPPVQSASVPGHNGKSAGKRTLPGQSCSAAVVSRPAVEKRTVRRRMNRKHRLKEPELKIAGTAAGMNATVKEETLSYDTANAEARVIAALTEVAPPIEPVSVIAKAATKSPDRLLVEYWTETE